MKLSSLTVYLFLLLPAGYAIPTLAKEPTSTIQIGFIPENIDFTEDDRYMVLEGENRYQVWDMTTNKIIIEGDYRFKVGRYTNLNTITEGSGYLLFPHEKAFMKIDYTLSFTEVVVYSLESGDILWETDQLDIGISMAASLLSVFYAANELFDVPGEDKYQAKSRRMRLSGGSEFVSVLAPYPNLDELVNYIPSLNAFAVNGTAGLQLVDVQTGAIKWTQTNVKGGVGEVYHLESQDVFVVIGVNSSELAHLSKPEIHGLNAKTGEVLWTTQYVGLYKPGHIHVVGETLVVTYYGVMLIDMKTGRESSGEVAKSMEKTRKLQRTYTVMGSEEVDVPNGYSAPYISDEGDLFVFTGLKGKGRNEFDIIAGKKGFVKISVPEDKWVAQTEDLAKQTQLVLQDEMNDDVLYVKVSKGLRSSYIIAIEANTGKVLFQTEPLKNKLGSEMTFFGIQGDQLIDLGVDGLYRYDKKTGEEISVLSHQEIGAGRLRDYIAYDQGLVMMGGKGVAVLNQTGDKIHRFNDFGKIKDHLQSEDELWLVEKKRFTRLSTKDMEVLEDMTFKRNENVFFSTSGKYFVKVNADGNKLDLYQL